MNYMDKLCEIGVYELTVKYDDYFSSEGIRRPMRSTWHITMQDGRKYLAAAPSTDGELDFIIQFIEEDIESIPLDYITIYDDVRWIPRGVPEPPPKKKDIFEAVRELMEELNARKMSE